MRVTVKCLLCIVLVAGFLAAQSLRREGTLRQAAGRRGMLIGAAVNVHYLSEPAYTRTLAREFNMVEPEDAMKWATLRPCENCFDFTDADRIVNFARLHGMRVRGHNLLWHSYNPDWLMQGHFTPKQLSHLLQDHISHVVGYYRGKVFAWDVVNEAFDENGKLHNSIWYNQPGISPPAESQNTFFIEQAFRWTHAADPQALLFYNDAEAEEINPHSDAIYALALDFKTRGVPLDGIGLQMHLLHGAPDYDSIAKNIKRFTNLGLQVHITELDVALPVDAVGRVLHVNDLQWQADVYSHIAEICLANPGCTALQTWGVTDKYSWVGWATHHTKGAALLFDRNYQPKPAYEAIKSALLRPAYRH